MSPWNENHGKYRERKEKESGKNFLNPTSQYERQTKTYLITDFL
jgi:hypothetical protein